MGKSAPVCVHECFRLFANGTAVMDQGLEEQVDAFLSDHQDTMLVIIDTLQMVCPIHDATYANDYRDLSVLKWMYEDSALGRVSNEQFCLLSEAYFKEKAQLAEAIPATEERLEKLRSSMANAKNFIVKARMFTDMTELNPELLRTFIAKIIV